MTTELADGSSVTDPRLGRLIQFDERSRAFQIRAFVADKPPRSYTWDVPVWLNQLSEGSCVGHAFAHELCARPVRTFVDHQYARWIYHQAQKVDPWPGEDYEGTSVLAGAKVCQSLGHFKEYRWAFGLNDLVLAIGYAGPVVLGVNWYRNMSQADSDGRLRPDGPLDGGHAILAYKVEIKTGKRAVPKVWLHNSWGQSWSVNGRGYLTWDDMERLLHEDGEACVPMKRQAA